MCSSDLDNYPALWDEYCEGKDPTVEADVIGEHIKNKLGLPICTLSPEQSKFFKRHQNSNRYNRGPLVREMDVIREIEGW